MTLSFNNFPNDLRVPLVGIEFDTTRLGGGVPGRKALVLGQRLATGSVAANVLTPVADSSLSDGYFGRSSMAAAMIRAFKAANRYADVWVLAQDDDGAGVAAAGAAAFTGPATAAGTLAGMIGGVAINTAVTDAMTAAQLATAFAAAVNASDLVPVTAAVDGIVTTKVNLTARHKGECGNDIDIRFNYYQGQAFPEGIAVVITAMTGGTTNPDIADAVAKFSDERWDTIICPYADAANLTLLEAELLSRWNDLRVKAGQAYTAYRETHANTITFGDGRNSALVSCMGTNSVPEPPYLWAAVNGAIAESSIAADPARQLRTLPLPGLKPPAVADRWDDSERNLLLKDGISTYTVDSGGVVRIDRQITMYQTNAAGVEDLGLLDVTTPASMIFMAIDLNSYFTAKYPRHKLADDGTKFAEGQPVVTPRLLRAEFLTKAMEWQEKGIVENLDQFKTDLVVERDPVNRNRVNALVPPDLVNNLMQLAILLQPRL